MSEAEREELSRRSVLHGAALVGAVVWARPVVTTLSGKTLAATGSTEVKGVKKPTTKVEGTKLPKTGADEHVMEAAVVGAGMVAAGAAALAAASRRREGQGRPRGRHAAPPAGS